MDNEIESLWLSLGIKPDDPSASDAVDKILKIVQSKLKSSIYGGKDGVITLPATIEGTYKNGKEIEKEIKDAYAAIYDKAKQMADESVSLTLKDIKNFEKQVNKFGKMTSSKTNNDVIANARNNINQLLSDYRGFVNGLKSEVATVQKKQIKQAQKTKAQQNAKNKKASYTTVSDEEINDAIEKENARQAKIKAWRDKQAEQLASKLDYRSGGIDPSRTNSYSLNASEFSEYESQWARELARSIKETYKTTVDKKWIDKEYKPKIGEKSRATSREEHLNFLSNAAFGDLADLIHKSEQGDEDVTFDKIVEAIGVLRTIFEENGKDMATIATAVINATQSRYDDNPKRRNGGVNREEGTEKGVGKGHEKTLVYQTAIHQLLKKMLGEVNTIKQKEVEASETSVKMTNAYEQAKTNAKNSEAMNDTKALAQELSGEKSRDEEQLMQTIRESSREGEADADESEKNQQLIDETVNNANTGTDSEAGKNEVIQAIKDTKNENAEFPAEQVKNVLANLGQTKQTDGKCPCQAILEGIRDAVQSINSKIQGKVGKTPTKRYAKKKETPDTTVYDAIKKALSPAQLALASANQPLLPAPKPVPVEGTFKNYYEGKDIVKNQKRQKEIEDERRKEQYKDSYSKEVDNLPDQNKITKAFADVIDRMFPSGSAVDKIMGATAEEQARIRAERIKQHGLNKGRDLTDTGDVAQIRRTKELFGWNYKSDKENKNLFQDVQLTPHVDIDTKAIMASVNKVLSGPEMFKAQTGGVWRNIFGSMTGYIGMPSLEKSRAEAEGLNQVMANVRNEVLKLLQAIQSKELTLHGMEESGEVSFTSDGYPTNSSSSASKKLFADLEEQKGVLRGVLAEIAMVDQVVGQTGGKVHDIIKNLGFVMPELMKNNTIIKNINDGLDKNGKALKFQTRTAEVLNYSFQLMARHIGQMIKNWIMMLNPLSLIKRAFQDFASYDVKWQRTMNVIKYNLRRIIKPFMEWLAQQLVNVIGLVNAIMKGIGKAFGKNWDLFDQSAASAEQMREELEQAANVTASFDELHDIGTSSSGNPAMDLMGDIYTPQWDGLYEVLENIGSLIGKIIKAVSKWSFWDWLKLAGLALAGYLALKWLLNLFGKGKNPLQTVAEGFSFLEKAVGWALLIWAFTEFTKALTAFVECMKTADWGDIAKSLVMLGGAFAELLGAAWAIQKFSKAIGTSSQEMLGLAALVFVFGLFVKAITPFIEVMMTLRNDFPNKWDQFAILASSLTMLASAFVELIAGVAGIEQVQKLIGLDWSSLLGLAAVVGVLDLFVLALVPFINAIKDIPDGEKIETIVSTFSALISSFLALAVGVGAASRMFKAMDWSSILQLGAVVAIFSAFMYVLIPFVGLLKDTPFDTLAGGALLIASAFMSLGGAIALLAPALAMLDWSSLAQGLILLAAMAGVLWVLTGFVEALQGLTSEQLLSGLLFLAGALMAVTVAIGILAVIFTALVGSGIGIVAILLLGLILAAISLVIFTLSQFVKALGEAGEGIKKICEGIELVVRAIGDVIIGVMTASAIGIMMVVTAIANGITAVLTPILNFMNNIMDKVAELSVVIAHEVGETIKTVIETVGKVIMNIINGIINAIPNLLQSIVRFCYDIGPAVENSVAAICRSVTKLVNFVVSAIEYMSNVIVSAINKLSVQIPDWVPGIGGKKWGLNFQKISISRFVPQYEQGTNYVPNDGLAYLHQGEAVVPKKYNTPYQSDNTETINAIERLTQQVSQITNKVEQGIPVKGQFVQRGSDLVATVERANNRMKNNVLNNRVYAR